MTENDTSSDANETAAEDLKVEDASPADRAEATRQELAAEFLEADQKRLEELRAEGKSDSEAREILATEQKERADKLTDKDGNRVSKTKGVLTGALAEEARAADEEKLSPQEEADGPKAA